VANKLDELSSLAPLISQMVGNRDAFIFTDRVNHSRAGYPIFPLLKYLLLQRVAYLVKRMSFLLGRKGKARDRSQLMISSFNVQNHALQQTAK